MKLTLWLISLFSTGLLFCQNDSLQKVTLKEVIIESGQSLKIIPKNGKYEVNVEGTFFQEAENTWEGLKQVPLLKVLDGNPITVTNKAAMIQVNGIETQLGGQDLEDYLKSIDPKTLQRIEIVTNPNASYEGGISAVVNIILSRKNDNYRLGINSTNGSRSRYYHNTNANYSVNLDKMRLYTNYSFNYLPTVNTSEVKRQIGSSTPINLNYYDNNLLRSHQAFTNLNFHASHKDLIDLTALFKYSENETAGSSFGESFRRNINLGSNGRNLRFAQIWKHNFNDSVSLKTGSYQVIRKSEALNISNTNALEQQQKIDTNIPIIIGFADFTNKNKYGFSSAGFRYNNINVRNNNLNNSQSWPFRYSEQVIAAYLNHNIALSDFGSLDMGIRSESTIIRYSLNSPVNQQTLSNSKNYTNLLYTATYSWYNNETTRASAISFKKEIERPNYSYLNPFRLISSDITYFSGDQSIDPAKGYTIGYETTKNAWTFYANAGYEENFISSFYELLNEQITLQYQNFESVRYTSVGSEYFQKFFNKRWTTKSAFAFSYFKLESEKHHLDESTPQISFSTVNNVVLGKDFRLNIDYSARLPFRDGTLKHYFSHRFDLTLTKKFNANFSAIAFAYDIFKTSIDGSETTVPGYFYASNYYNDVRAFGLSLRWNVTGKMYRNREVEEPSGSEIDRL